MASRSAPLPIKTARAVEMFGFQFFPNGSSTDPLTVDDYGSGRVASVARTSNAGEYLVTLADAYYKIGHIHATLSMGTLPTTVLLEAPTTSGITNEGNGSAVTFLVRIRGMTPTAATVPTLADMDLNSIAPDAQQDIVDVGTTSTVDAELIEANDSTLGTGINALNAAVEALAAEAGVVAIAGYDVAADATNYFKVSFWAFSGSIPA